MNDEPDTAACPVPSGQDAIVALARTVVEFHDSLDDHDCATDPDADKCLLVASVRLALNNTDSVAAS